MRERRSRQAGSTLVLAWVFALAAALGFVEVSPAAAPPRVYDSGLRNRPGWYPPSDPESSSVLTGRRDAPAVAMKFSGGRHSLEGLARAALRALESGSADSLRSLCVTRKEFEVILWPEFPGSRSVTGLTATDGWRALGNRLVSGSRGAASDFGGTPYDLVGAHATAGITRFRNFNLHRGFTIDARDSTGAVRRFDFIRSVAEREGVFKIYSMRD